MDWNKEFPRSVLLKFQYRVALFTTFLFYIRTWPLHRRMDWHCYLSPSLLRGPLFFFLHLRLLNIAIFSLQRSICLSYGDEIKKNERKPQQYYTFNVETKRKSYDFFFSRLVFLNFVSRRSNMIYDDWECYNNRRLSTRR